MKKLIVLFALLNLSIFGQVKNVQVIDFGTIGNAVTTERFVDINAFGSLLKFKQVDSIAVSLVNTTANCNIDSINFYVGASLPGTAFTGSQTKFSATAITQISTLAAVGMQQLFTSNASPLTGSNLRGVDMLKISIPGSPSGNAAGNKVYLFLQYYGTK